MTTPKVYVIHPGRVLLEQFIAAQGISVFRLARDRPGSTFDQRRYCPPSRALLRHVRALLARSAGAVRWQPRK